MREQGTPEAFPEQKTKRYTPDQVEHIVDNERIVRKRSFGEKFGRIYLFAGATAGLLALVFELVKELK